MGGRALYRATGSLAFIAAARAGWLVIEDPDDASRRLFLPAKMNLAEQPSGLAFRVMSVTVDGIGEIGRVVLVVTGLRKGELASLTVGQLDLDGPTPGLTLRAADEKNRQGSYIPLRHDLAADLRQWLSDKGTWLRGEPGASGGALALRLPPETPCAPRSARS